MARSITASVASGSSRNRGVLMLAALFGILSAGLMFAFLSNRDSGGNDLDKALTSQGGAQDTVVLTRNVNVGERITSDMLTTKPVPTAALLPDHVTNPEDLIGKVATAPLFEGEQVLSVKVTSYEGQDTLAYKVPEGMRSLSLQIPHEAWEAAGLVQPGDRVDVLGITTFVKTDPLTGEEKPNVVAGLVAQNVEVLAVAQKLVKVIPNVDAAKTDSTDGTTGTEGTKTAPVVNGAQIASDPTKPAETYETAISITLALTPEQAAKIGILDAMKDDQGQYRIMARQKGDSTPVTGTTVWNFDDLFTSTIAK